MGDPVAFAADAMAAGLAVLGAPRDLTFATVRAVNGDGTVSLDSGPGVRTSVRCVRSYGPRAAGDSVLVVTTAAGPVVVGAIGGPVSDRPFTLSDASAPGGQGWEETVSGQVWAKGDGSQWQKRVVSAPPPAGVTVSHTAVVGTYRSGGLIASGKAEQGDYTGRGLCTGLATFGSWAALGATATGGTLTFHRRAGGHGFTHGPVNAYAWKTSGTGLPAATPALVGDPVGAAAALNETVSVGLGAGWCQPFADGTSDAIGFFSNNSRDNIEIDAVTLTIYA